jgi:acetyl esterase/lipase
MKQIRLNSIAALAAWAALLSVSGNLWAAGNYTRIDYLPPKVVDLWPGKAPSDIGIPGQERRTIYVSPAVGPTLLITNVTRPSLTIYAPPADRNTGAAMVICPGGGYHDLFWELEGEQIAYWCNTAGMTGIILKYRVPERPGEDPHKLSPIGPQIDAQRSISLIRSHAAEWGISPDKIGIVGFSAGGHLAVATATGFDQRKYTPIDAADQASCRPNFAIGCYSGYLKANGSDALWPGLHIPAGTPPIFLAHCSDDPMSSVEHSVIMYLALHRAGVETELHLFSAGGHDFAVTQNQKLPAAWPQLCLAWLRHLEILPAVPQSQGP